MMCVCVTRVLTGLELGILQFGFVSVLGLKRKLRDTIWGGLVCVVRHVGDGKEGSDKSEVASLYGKRFCLTRKW